MSANRRTFLKAAALSTGMLAAGGMPAAADPAFDLGPVRALITRYIGSKACQFELRRLPPGGLDQFQISGERGHLVLAGNSPNALTVAFNWWAKYVARAHISWNYNQLNLPSHLPAPATPDRPENGRRADGLGGQPRSAGLRRAPDSRRCRGRNRR